MSRSYAAEFPPGRRISTFMLNLVTGKCQVITCAVLLKASCIFHPV